MTKCTKCDGDGQLYVMTCEGLFWHKFKTVGEEESRELWRDGWHVFETKPCGCKREQR